MTDLQALQWEKLRRVLDAVKTPGHYFEQAASRIDSLEAFRREMPLISKEAISEEQENQPLYGRFPTRPLDEYIRFSQTSGTQGKPLRWLDTADSWAWMVHCWRAVLRASGVTRGETAFFAFSFGPFLGFWTAWDAALSVGCRCVPAGGLSSAGRRELLVSSGATVLFCTPTYAIRLGEQIGWGKADSPIRRILVAGEPGGSLPEVRALIERLWPGAKVFDHHGMTEIGPVTVPCPSGASDLRALEEEYLVEVLDPETGEPVGPGETGELVLTNLGRVAMPLFRYRTGDLVKVMERIPDATDERRFIGFEGGILARRDDMVVVRGVNLYPAAVDRIVRRHPQVHEYRVTVRKVRGMREIEMEIELELDDPMSAELHSTRLAESLSSAFGLRFPVRWLPRGTLPEFEMKAKRWVRV